MELTLRMRFTCSVSMLAGFSRARSQPTCRCCCRPSSISLSISRPRKRLASRYQTRSSHRQLRSLNDVAYWALFGHGAMSDLSPLSGVKRKLDFGAVRAAFDLGCVKTCTSRECAELFSLFSSFDGGCQSGSFLIQRNPDKLSTRKFDAGVFTRPGPRADI